ncbi:MAG: Gfo/Idh/MocA family oxidoreductase [bacterium]|jgi:predicted dehydrogenase
MLRIGVIGVGYMGFHHARIYSQNKVCKLIGIYDVDENKAKMVAENLGTVYYKDVKDLIKNVDAVSIAVPTDKHYEVAKMVLNYSKHILIEKPITDNLEQAEELKDLAYKKGVILMVGHTERFNPVLKQVINYIKKPVFIEVIRMGPLPNRKPSTGVILDLMIHDIDIVVNFLLKGQKIREINAVGNSVYDFTLNEDIANASITFENDTIVVLTSSRCHHVKERKIRIIQAENSIYADYISQYVEIHYVPLNIYKHANYESFEMKVEIPNVIRYEPLRLELMEFINSVNENREPLVTVDDGINALKVSFKMLKKIYEQFNIIDKIKV